MKKDLAELVELILCRPLLTRKDLARRYGRDTDTIDRWKSSGKLPKPIYLPGCRFPYWTAASLRSYETRGKLKPKP